jgi:hypothetical protein
MSLFLPAYGRSLKLSIKTWFKKSNLVDQLLQIEIGIKSELNFVRKDLEATKTSLANTRIRLSNMKYTVDDLTTKLNGKTILFRIFLF